MIGRNILIVAVHADDETLGCGGTLLKAKAEGARMHWLLVTREHMSEKPCIPAVQAAYPFDSMQQLPFDSARLDAVPRTELIAGISAVFKEIAPDTVFLPFYSDVHSDHRVAFEAAYPCTKSFRYPSVTSVYMTEIPSETDFAPALQSTTFAPTVFVDITGYLERKIEIMRLYAREMGIPPFPRSERGLRGLATIRGAVAGCEYAEAFMLLKSVYR